MIDKTDTLGIILILICHMTWMILDAVNEEKWDHFFWGVMI